MLRHVLKYLVVPLVLAIPLVVLQGAEIMGRPSPGQSSMQMIGWPLVHEVGASYYAPDGKFVSMDLTHVNGERYGFTHNRLKNIFLSVACWFLAVMAVLVSVAPNFPKFTLSNYFVMIASAAIVIVIWQTDFTILGNWNRDLLIPDLNLSQSFRPVWHNIIAGSYLFMAVYFLLNMTSSLFVVAKRCITKR